MQEKGGKLAMLSAWGSTETSPLATQVHFHIARAGVIGLPVAGCELKLVPSAGKQEVRVRGPNVTPGYYKRPDLTRLAFDEEGFYRLGDALRYEQIHQQAKLLRGYLGERGQHVTVDYAMRYGQPSIASRLDESRELSRYMTGLLIFLGGGGSRVRKRG